jgi:pyruvate formate lyase activating enzyme
MSEPAEVAGWITDIEHFSTRDGPGIRTTVFFQGCPLKCRWCSNPETWFAGARLYRRAARCVQCGACVATCTLHAIDLARAEPIDRASCNNCMDCVQVCPHAALERVGRQCTVRDVVDEVMRDLPFYGPSGGVTLSGGEPLAQPAFLSALVGGLRREHLSIVLDTSGVGPAGLLSSLLDDLDLVLLDIKHMDSERHRQGTGVGNEAILAAARAVAGRGKLRISMPLIPGFNDDPDNVLATGQFARSLGVDWLDLMPMHALGSAKYGYLGISSPFGALEGQSTTSRSVQLLRSLGLQTTIGRMM